MDNMSDEESRVLIPVDNASRQGRWLRTDINVISFAFSMMFLGLILCYPSAKVLGRYSPLFNIDNPSDPECKYTIDEHAKRNFERIVIDKEVKLLYVNISVPLNQCFECTAIMPMHWAWVSDRNSEASTFMTLQEDYVIWSLSILDFYNGGDIKTPINVSSPCEERLGEHRTMRHIAESLNMMVSEKLSDLKQNFNNSMWCYRAKLNTLDPFEDQFVRNFRFFDQDMATDCYTFKDNGRHFIKPSTLYTDIPFVLTFISILFSPLMVVYILHFLYNNSPVPWLDWGGSPSDPVPSADSYVYLCFKSPHTFTSIIITSISSYLPSIPDTLKQVSILVLAPIVIYVKVLIYLQFDKYSLLKRQIQHNISIGFSSMLFPHDLKSQNFLTLTGGPCYFFLLYHVVGLLLIVIYKYITFSVQAEQEREAATESNIPLDCLHLNAMKSIRNHTLTSKILNVIAENSVNRVCSKKFWCDVWESDRWWQLPFSFLFHIIPILYVNQLVLKLSLVGISDKFASCRRRRICTIIFCGLFGILQFIFLFTFATIFFASLEFIALVLSFCYISMVTYPAESAGYFLFGVTAFYYLSRCVRDIARTYQHLLLLSVEASKELEKDFRLQHAGRKTPCPEFVHYENNSLGIPSARFEKLVDKYEPKSSTLIKGVLKTIVVFGLLGWTLKLLYKFHETRNLSPLVNLFGAVVIIKLPELLAILSTDFRPEKEDSICMIHLKNTIKIFVAEEAEQKLLSDEEAAQSCSGTAALPKAGASTPLSAPVVAHVVSNPSMNDEARSSVNVPSFENSVPTGAKRARKVKDKPV